MLALINHILRSTSFVSTLFSWLLSFCQDRFARYEGLYTHGDQNKPVPRWGFLRMVPALLYSCTEGPMLDSPATYRAIQDLALSCTCGVAGQPAVALQVMRQEILDLINGEVRASGVNMYMGLLQVA